MSHHSSDPEMERQMREAMKGIFGEFPDGKMDQTDEGGIAMAVTHVSGRVKLQFPKPVAWLGLRPDEALGLAELLIQHADRASGYDAALDARVADLKKKLRA